jgi:DNA polymerase III subunit gamma/tau
VYKPVQGRFKVFMIDEVHMLTNTAFNAMLKTLEEPPEYLKFVLATTDPQKVPVTVLSRCLQFNLRPMAPETVLEHLQQVLQAEQVSADVQSLRLISRAARGSMRDALSLTDQAIAFGGGQLQEATVRQMLGAVDRSYVLRLIDALTRSDGAQVVETVDALRLNGLSAASTLEEMTGVLQRMAVLQAVPGHAQTEGQDDPDEAQIAQLAQTLPADETQLLYSLCLHGRGELGLAPDEYAALTMVLLRLLAFKPAGAVEKKTLKTAEPRLASPPASPPLPAPAPVVAPAPLSASPAPAPAVESDEEPPWPEDDGPPWEEAEPAPGRVLAIPVRDAGEPGRLDQPQPRAPEPAAAMGGSEEGDFWFDTVMQLARAEAITALVRELGLQSQLVARDAGQWMLRVERSSLNQGNARDRLAAALQTLGHEVRLVVEIGSVTDSPARRLAFAAQQRQQQAEALILGDPFVQSMMRDFGGKIVPGSIKATSA